MNRRKFTKLSALGGLFTFSTGGSGLLHANDASSCIKKNRLANRLKKGDTIGLIAPASAFSKEQYKAAIEHLKSFGFKIKEGAHLHDRKGYLAGEDRERAADINAFFADDSIDGIWCLRGGYGVTRLLSMLDYKTIKKNPKALIGYSDITALLLAIHHKTGLIGFHGPVATSDFPDYTFNAFQEIVMDGKMPTFTLAAPNQARGTEDGEFEARTIKGGKAQGKLLGGNLSLLSAMVGTPYLPSAKNAIVFIEDIGEKPYRIDRMMTQLLESGWLKEAKGIAFGIFNDCHPSEGDRSLTLKEVIDDRVKGLNIPIAYGYSFGHIDNQMTLPVGAKVELDATNISLRLLEMAVK